MKKNAWLQKYPLYPMHICSACTKNVENGGCEIDFALCNFCHQQDLEAYSMVESVNVRKEERQEENNKKQKIAVDNAMIEHQHTAKAMKPNMVYDDRYFTPKYLDKHNYLPGQCCGNHCGNRSLVKSNRYNPWGPCKQ